jgi:methyltransferase (TIGR00027 family)
MTPVEQGRATMRREDNDSWDLLTGVGTTATGIAAARALASKGADSLISDPFARPLVEALGVDYYLKMADGELEGEETDSFDLSVMADGIAVRTQFFDEFFLNATGTGLRQAVILASGLDTRAYRMQWPAGTTVFELDQPEVIDFKSRTLADMKATPTARLHSIGIDLRLDWPSALLTHGFDTSRPTAWIAEGLHGYLPAEAQDRFLDTITDLSATASRIAIDWHPDLNITSNDRSREVSRSERQRSNGVDIKDPSDMIYLGPRNNIGDYLRAQGWQIQTHTAEQRFAANNMTFHHDDAAAGLLRAHYTVATLG